MSTPTGGVKPINIAGRVASERERLIGMTNEERAWRAKYLKSQILAPEEPLNTAEYYKASFNPLRRLYKAPMNLLERTILIPVMGTVGGSVCRRVISLSIQGIIVIYCGWYHYRYNMSTWERHGGWHMTSTEPALIPTDKNYPNYKIKKPNEYATLGFENSKL
ncbi:NADH dehydrogenase (ubiquinone) B17 subunit [Nomia melanderi]|uniref:NADH dehydrogenase (ubiquinone) B17 subunit n=1 Tax=Nomia melanderi TaxID=2448451 RepID=UPI0013042F27|nr:uncharacterized protein LOC116431946 [Nomia melanderi]XP_031843973.1 uncharacterized protein LOC116431946 [Nomia melanderi]XP_031843974.1 uncharacterized protein LOC116431946 [Nomia melanderi]XP_031843975.1 uncharacterized protein LOC116431946 [Nomia melanderi]